MLDETPKEDPSVFNASAQDPEYKRKLELSYIKCLDELCNPQEDWEDVLGDIKFTMDSETGRPYVNYDFILDHPDDIMIPNSNHSYVFKRSHFYVMFQKKSSRVKRDLIKCWRDRGYYVNLVFDTDLQKWKLCLSWREN